MIYLRNIFFCCLSFISLEVVSANFTSFDHLNPDDQRLHEILSEKVMKDMGDSPANRFCVVLKIIFEKKKGEDPQKTKIFLIKDVVNEIKYKFVNGKGKEVEQTDYRFRGLDVGGKDKNSLDDPTKDKTIIGEVQQNLVSFDSFKSGIIDGDTVNTTHKWLDCTLDDKHPQVVEITESTSEKDDLTKERDSQRAWSLWDSEFRFISFFYSERIKDKILEKSKEEGKIDIIELHGFTTRDMCQNCHHHFTLFLKKLKEELLCVQHITFFITSLFNYDRCPEGYKKPLSDSIIPDDINCIPLRYEESIDMKSYTKEISAAKRDPKKAKKNWTEVLDDLRRKRKVHTTGCKEEIEFIPIDLSETLEPPTKKRETETSRGATPPSDSPTAFIPHTFPFAQTLTLKQWSVLRFPEVDLR